MFFFITLLYLKEIRFPPLQICCICKFLLSLRFPNILIPGLQNALCFFLLKYLFFDVINDIFSMVLGFNDFEQLIFNCVQRI